MPDHRVEVLEPAVVVEPALLPRRRGPAAQSPDDSMDRFPAAGARPGDAAGRRELAGILRELIDELPGHLRPVYVLREVEHLSGDEVAVTLDLSPERLGVRRGGR